MAKKGFIIKLSNETVQKLSEEEQNAKTKVDVDPLHVPEGIPVVGVVPKIKEVVSEPIEVIDHDDETDDNNQSENINPSDLDEQRNTKLPEKLESSSTNADPSAWGNYAPYVTYEGQDTIYTDPNTKHRYEWQTSTNSWVSKIDATDVPGRVFSYENDTHICTEADGTKSFWDKSRNAWIPKVDDDFLALYQMSYGFVDNKTDTAVEEAKKKELKVPEPAGAKRKADPQWFQPSEETNTKVYVSNLPLDINEEEFVDFMQKCGLVERDPATQKMKVKLYMDKEHNCFKGDALCTYIKIESVDLALKLIDGSDFKGNKIKVERAHFQLKGEYNPSLKPKKKKKKELEKIKKMQQKLFDWRPEKFIGERSKHERIVIVKNLFHPTDFDKDVQLILDYQQDLREECNKCGEVRKVMIYDRHPEGVAQITMKEPEQADAVIQLIGGRWFGKRQITAEIWDGRTKYRIAETDADINQRIDKWGRFLEGKEDDKNPSNTVVQDSAISSSEEKCETITQKSETVTQNSEGADDISKVLKPNDDITVASEGE